MKNSSNEINDLLISLNKKLMINDQKWHNFKGDKNKRAAELISAALCQLIIGDNESEAIVYLEQSIKWIKGDIKDQPCPRNISSSKS